MQPKIFKKENSLELLRTILPRLFVRWDTQACPCGLSLSNPGPASPSLPVCGSRVLPINSYTVWATFKFLLLATSDLKLTLELTLSRWMQPWSLGFHRKTRSLCSCQGQVEVFFIATKYKRMCSKSGQNTANKAGWSPFFPGVPTVKCLVWITLSFGQVGASIRCSEILG